MTTKHKCEQCGERYDEAGDGWCGTCPSCADKSAANDERREHARRWANVLFGDLHIEALAKAQADREFNKHQ